MKLNDMNPKIRYFQTEFKSIRNDVSKPTIVKGYASTSTEDRYKDMVEPEAFRQSILGTYSKNPIILFQHDPSVPIGKAVHLSIDGKGLYIEAEIYKPDVEEKIEQGILRAMSIGYIPLEIEYRDKDGIPLNPKDSNDRMRIWGEEGVKRIIKRLDLVEVSIVSVPANPSALFTMEKSLAEFFEDERKSLTPDTMDTKENLLNETKKDEPVNEEPPKETETPLVEAEPAKAEETPPAEETKPEEPKEEPTKEPEAEPAKVEPPAVETPSTEGGEKPEDKATLGIAVKAINQLMSEKQVLAAEVNSLKKQLSTIPTKQPLINLETTKFQEKKSVPKDEPKANQFSGIKEAILSGKL